MSIIDISSLPIKTFVRETLLPEGYFVGKAGIKLRNWKKEWEFLCGFSFNNNKEDAKRIANFELLERLFARFEIQSLIHKSFNTLPLFSWPELKQIDVCDFGNILIGNNPYSNSGIEAAGLSLHDSIETASEHAIFELLERHLCTKLWYTDELKLQCLKYINIDLSNYEINCYSIKECPFVLAEVFSKEKNIGCYGHAIRKSFKNAAEKAISEALMLLDCVLHNDTGICSNERTKNRIFSLKGEITQERHKYLQNISENHINEFPKKEYSCLEVVKKLLESEKSISIVPLFQDSYINVVRALSPQVETLASRRYLDKLPSRNAILDPFC